MTSDRLSGLEIEQYREEPDNGESDQHHADIETVVLFPGGLRTGSAKFLCFHKNTTVCLEYRAVRNVTTPL